MNIQKDEVHINPNSTWINPGIKTLEQLKDWVLTKLGYPLVSIELTENMLMCQTNI